VKRQAGGQEKKKPPHLAHDLEKKKGKERKQCVTGGASGGRKKKGVGREKGQPRHSEIPRERKKSKGAPLQSGKIKKEKGGRSGTLLIPLQPQKSSLNGVTFPPHISNKKKRATLFLPPEKGRSFPPRKKKKKETASCTTQRERPETFRWGGKAALSLTVRKGRGSRHYSCPTTWEEGEEEETVFSVFPGEDLNLCFFWQTRKGKGSPALLTQEQFEQG